MNFDYDSFFSRANRRFVLSEGQRYGQFLMNYLHECHPEIVVPKEYDCFYDNSKVTQFLEYLSQLSDR